MCKRIPFHRLRIDPHASTVNVFVIDVDHSPDDEVEFTSWFYVPVVKDYPSRASRFRGHLPGSVSAKHTPICEEMRMQLLTWAVMRGWRASDA